VLLYPKFEKLSTQRGVAKLLIAIFSTMAFIGFMLILLKYNLLFNNKLKGVFFNDNYFINLYVECFSGALIVVAWLSIIKETQKIYGNPNWGLAWLALAIAFWCFGDLFGIAIEFHNDLVIGDQQEFKQSTRSIIDRVISTCNSFCFLYSLRYLEFNENSKWKQIRDQIEEWHSIALVATLLFGLIFITIVLGFIFGDSNSKILFIPDLAVSFITTAALWIFFTEYFQQRGIEYMKYFITIVVIVILIVQFSHVFEQHELDPFYLQKGAPILCMVYRPFLIMLFLFTAFSSLRNEKEKQAILERRDMNHAIRGSLHIINKDIDRLLKKEKTNKNYENTFTLQDFAFRTKSIYDLHNLIHNEYGGGKISLKEYLNNLIENAKYAFDYTNLRFNFVAIDNIYVERNLLRKIGTVLTELITNSAKAAIKKSSSNNHLGFILDDKLLEIIVGNYNILLKITVSDNGIFRNDILTKTSTGHGLNLIKRTIIEDFEGKVGLEINQYDGTSISIEIPLSNLI